MYGWTTCLQRSQRISSWVGTKSEEVSKRRLLTADNASRHKNELTITRVLLPFYRQALCNIKMWSHQDIWKNNCPAHFATLDAFWQSGTDVFWHIGLSYGGILMYRNVYASDEMWATEWLDSVIYAEVRWNSCPVIYFQFRIEHLQDTLILEIFCFIV